MTEKYQNPLLYIEVIDVSSVREVHVCDMSRLTQFPFYMYMYINLSPALRESIKIQRSPFITLCLGSIELDRVISEPCYKGIIL